jgi:hypothetical protein
MPTDGRGLLVRIKELDESWTRAERGTGTEAARKWLLDDAADTALRVAR